MSGVSYLIGRIFECVVYAAHSFLLWARWFLVEVRFPQSSTFDVSVSETENKYMYS